MKKILSPTKPVFSGIILFAMLLMIVSSSRSQLQSLHVGKTIIKDSTNYTVFSKGVIIPDSLKVKKDIYMAFGKFYMDTLRQMRIYPFTNQMYIENSKSGGGIYFMLGDKNGSMNVNSIINGTESTIFTLDTVGLYANDVKVRDSLLVGKDAYVVGNLNVNGYFYLDTNRLISLVSGGKVFSIVSSKEGGCIHMVLGPKVGITTPNFSIGMKSGPGGGDVPLMSIDSINGMYVNYGGFDVRNGGTYRTAGVPGYITSAYGTLTASGIYGSSSSGIFNAVELYYVDLTINGVTRKVLCADTGGDAK
jgi:hypothetical protein